MGGDGYRAFAAVAPVLDGYEEGIGPAGSDLLEVEGRVEVNGGDGEVVGLLGVGGVADIGGTLPGRIGGGRGCAVGDEHAAARDERAEGEQCYDY